ncbi:p-hydroxycinnamoyl CoA hydratase/lyase (plasmid) [Roseomonas sp. OT10]|uniref:p-hydroxycinnamoyl CoA hydratase/lyase n=1 Tax=Roseomonas cutis TaxID=2897332 RepID=UPI001E3C3DB8|nr:p-hydroxycinnamoyl CoA hydratase/lyase [Roseomonas sp. OT10]UFN51542.1 p-hydroxycinnamoyl CoA hydratase/lyase [Roseomonas sp. OT10]
MELETLKIAKADGIATVTLNRPNKRNCMSPQLHQEMTEVLAKLRYDDEVRVVIITGAGDNFCAGMDLKEFFIALKDKPAEYERVWRQAAEWRGRTLRYYPKATIAMINGYCFGGAFSIVEGCDLAIAAEDATFGLSEINFKLFPGGTVSKSLANLLRPRDALWYGMTGRPFDGKTAAQIGLINLAVPRAELLETTMQVARELASKDPHAMKATKDGYRMSLEMSWDAACSYSFAKEQELVVAQGDAWRKEGIGDFLQGKYRPGLESHGAGAA